jgi:hypothetical protein
VHSTAKGSLILDVVGSAALVLREGFSIMDVARGG